MRLTSSPFSRLAIIGLVMLVASSCNGSIDSGDRSCFLGPCSGAITIPDSSYDIVGWPASQATSFGGFLSPGDSVHLYFVRLSYLNPCDAPAADTIGAGGRWLVTKPLGGPVDTSVAAITPLPDGSAVLRAKSVGEFGIWYERDAPSAQPLGVWQDVTICPANFPIFDFRVK